MIFCCRDDCRTSGLSSNPGSHPPTPGTYAQPLGTASVHQGTTESCVGGVVSQAPGWAPCPSFSFGLKDCRTSRGVKEGPTVSHCFVCYHTAKSTQDNAGSMRSWFIPGGTFPWSPQRPGLVCGLELDYRAGPGPMALAWELPGRLQSAAHGTYFPASTFQTEAISP